MRFGKPRLLAEPAAPTEPQEREIVKVKVTVRGGWEWAWRFWGEGSRETAQALFNKLTGEPDAQGWIRNDGDDWAYRQDEVRSVVLRIETEKVSA